MLFNSYIFLFAFLPLTLGAFYIARKKGQHAALITLIVASLIFYAWSGLFYLSILVVTTVIDYVIAVLNDACRRKGMQSRARSLMIAGVVMDLGVLAYFKYLSFVVFQATALVGDEPVLMHIFLPIGISFYTFQKVAFHVDVYRGKIDKVSFGEFIAFVTFFPQLIAGPIVHHSELVPQLRRLIRPSAAMVKVGLAFIIMGLFKKVVIADSVATVSTPVFTAAFNGADPTFGEAWGAALAYTGQIYFDFSAYSDMAIGLALLFGLRLPINFYSPYKATNLIEFWRRWHITLSRFLRDYVYFSLGGNRKGEGRRYVNLLLTMLIGGIWHGAGWAFVIWGAIHGCCLAINHAVAGRAKRKGAARSKDPLVRFFGWFLTMLVVIFAWVFFRAGDLGTALRICAAMLSPETVSAAEFAQYTMPVIALGIAVLMPNTHQLTHYFATNREDVGHVKPWFWRLKTTPLRRQGLVATVLGLMLAANIASLSRVSEFIYFQF